MAKTEHQDLIGLGPYERRLRGSPARRAGRGANLQETLVVLRQRKWSILAVTLAVTGIALLASSRQTPVYEAEARVLVMPVPGEFAPGSQTPTVPNMATEAELASSTEVARLASAQLGASGSPAELLDGLSVEPASDTEILVFTYRHTDPAVARRRAQGFATSYLSFREGIVDADIERALRTNKVLLADLQNRLSILLRTLARLPADHPSRVWREPETGLLQNKILEREAERAAIPTDVPVGRVVEPPILPTSPVSPNHVVNGAFGLVAGLFLGIGLAFVRDRVSDRLRSPHEVEEITGLPVLGAIPRVPGWRKRHQAFFVTLLDSHSPAAEAYRMLRTNTLSAAAAAGAKSLVVTSAHSGEGKSATAANLAVVMASAGKRVTLVSADLRRPRLHEFFGVGGHHERPLGLVDVLSRDVPLDGALVEIIGPRAVSRTSLELDLRILPTGPLPEDPAELLASGRLHDVVRQLEETSDFVIIDTPPILPVTDALIVGQIAGGVLLVVGPRSMTESGVASARQHLDRVGARVLGVVVNGHTRNVEHSYYGRYGE